MFDWLVEPGPPPRVGLLLLPGFSLAELALWRTAQAQLHQLAGPAAGACLTLSADGAPVLSDLGLPTPVDAALSPAALDGLSALLVFASGLPPPLPASDARVAALSAAARARLVLGGVHAGAFWLAAAGLLGGCRASVHWSLHEAFAERYPQVALSGNLFEFDRQRLTCGGGVAVLDMFLALTARQHGQALAGQVAEHFLLERLRPGDERQRVGLRAQLGATPPKLAKAVALMEAHMEDLLTTDQIADQVCVSRRQLERLFKQALDQAPSQYYLELRLNRARQLLRQTSGSIIQIGLSCGFSSGSHFSNAYRHHFGLSPREERRQGGGDATACRANASPAAGGCLEWDAS
ncbi:GlxA family transcriptional regulator [Rivihabitans pingtungensis]|uniref:Transcriptional regulator GlxA family with amidase domain n=1 Tax=Rivihabitans pingtungensis TaxID=1054498 RepID=A0A318KQA8_9NEIS|nr:GlxA family transcriptional regulator [Rivihabitans pingtungensis]PXX77915.1 transcriptional regulator GlxA family with amidase domain [Rivihabitans pingtungensis]